MVKVFLVILFLNFITCLITRKIQGGRFTYNKKTYPDYNGKNILIAGMLSQPENAYKYVELPYCHSAYLRFSPFGYNPKISGEQLRKLIRSKDVVVGLSVGCKSIIFAHRPETCRILVNPMTHSITLKAEKQLLIEYLSPIAEVLSYLLGWLAVIPVIKTGTGDFYSIALLVDQLFWMYYDDPHFDDIGKMNKIGVVISTDDEYLENHIIKGIYNCAEFVEIDTAHGQITNREAVYEYSTAISILNFLA